MSWANESLIEDGRSQSDIRQGVTLEVLGEELRVRRELRGKHLDGDDAVQPRIDAAILLPRPALPDEGIDYIRPEPRT